MILHEVFVKVTQKAHVKKGRKKPRSLVGAVMTAVWTGVWNQSSCTSSKGEVLSWKSLHRSGKRNATWCLFRHDASERVDAIVDCSFSAHATEESVGISSALCNVAASYAAAKPFGRRWMGAKGSPRQGARGAEPWGGLQPGDPRLKTLHFTGTKRVTRRKPG